MIELAKIIESITKSPPLSDLLLVVAISVAILGTAPHLAFTQGTHNALSRKLQMEPPQKIVDDAMQHGDVNRGAILFFQHQLQCAACHDHKPGSFPSGPDLARKREKISRSQLVESILAPSKVILDGFKTVSVVEDSGAIVTGVLETETDDELTVRTPTEGGRRLSFKKDEVEDWRLVDTSIMPEGQVDQLASRQQFLDLARYVIEVAEKGPKRARELRPPPSLIQLAPLPDYEHRVDHAAIISSWDEESLDHGKRLYNRVCANCHGTHEREGSLPTAPRFARDPLKRGSDPFRMYQTLTHGSGMMVAQRWMVPRQKYNVIQYIREAYFRGKNPSQLTAVNDKYIAGLPAGDTIGPEPVMLEPYITMDYGPTLNHTYEIALNNTGDDKDVGRNLGRGPRLNAPWANPDEYFGPGNAPNFAYKGIAFRLNPGPGGITRGTHWAVYDHDTLNLHAMWSGSSFIDYSCIQFDGRHGVHNRLTGTIHFQNPVGPGWAHPLTGSFTDPRPLGRDGRAYGPLPRDWARYRGLYQHGDRAILSYEVGGAEILELPGTIIQAGDGDIYTRTFSIGPAHHSLAVRVAPDDLHVSLSGDTDATVEKSDGFFVMRVPARQHTVDVVLHVSSTPLQAPTEASAPGIDLRDLIQGGPSRWLERVETQIKTVHDDIFRVDNISWPEINPWNCQIRPTGHDFFDDGRRAAVCTWDGDVWIVDGINQDQGKLTWQRVANGMFQPLGLKIIDDQIYVACRDQIIILRDLNGDNETDFYECFNNDHQVTEHFHEFAMGLQVDERGYLYYAKSARHAKRAVVPHHGTLLRVHPDGSQTDILATGFRAANGVCLNPDGTFFVTDQEGHWNPKNRINWINGGGFYGNMYGFTEITDPSDDAMLQPLCWITNEFDRSPAELLWVPPETWGPLSGSLLNLSYGYGMVYVVPHQRVGEQIQGGMCELPIPRFPSGLVRGRFHPTRDELFLCGMFSWAGSQQEPGGFYRIGYRGKPAHLPVGLNAAKQQIEIVFSHELDESQSLQPGNFQVMAWDLRRTADYGSDHYNERELTVSEVRLLPDRRSVTLKIPELAPTWCMSIEYELRGANGRTFSGEIHNSIHALPPSLKLTADRAGG